MLDAVRAYYGTTLKSSDDLRTDACCTLTAPPAHVAAALEDIHPEVAARYYGCGLVVPEMLAGQTILDLGCGAGRDLFLLARLAGRRGRVIGVDMTREQLDVARAHVDWHMARFGYPRPMVEIYTGLIESLNTLPIRPHSVDIIVSNCVLNLSTDKRAVLAGARRLLRQGGEIYFADVYADARIPEALRRDPVLYGECLSGALFWDDFLELARETGFADPRLVEARPLAISDRAIADRLGGIGFASATFRLFKADGLEAAPHDHGQSATYLGTIDHCKEAVAFDINHRFVAGKATAIDGNTAHMLAQSRLAPHFRITAGRTQPHAAKVMPAIGEILAGVEPAPAGCCG